MGINKRKLEGKKTRKRAFDQESDQKKEKKTITVKKKKKERKHALDQETDHVLLCIIYRVKKTREFTSSATIT